MKKRKLYKPKAKNGFAFALLLSKKNCLAAEIFATAIAIFSVLIIIRNVKKLKKQF